MLIRDWKDKVALAIVGVGLSILMGLGGVLLTNGGEDQSAPVAAPTAITAPPTPTQPAEEEPTPTATPTTEENIPVDYDALMKNRCDELGYVWDDGVCRTVEGQHNLERIQEEWQAELPCPPDTDCYQPNPDADSWDRGYRTAMKYCTGELVIPPPPPPPEMPNLQAGFMAGLQSGCGYIPDIYTKPAKTLCDDGWPSTSTGRGTCSWHGGIAR